MQTFDFHFDLALVISLRSLANSVGASGDKHAARPGRTMTADPSDSPPYRPLDGTCMVDREEVEGKLAEIKRLEKTLASLQSEHAANVERCEEAHAADKAKLHDDFELAAGRQQYYVNEFTEEIDLLETNQRSEMARLDAEHQANLLATRADGERSLSKEKKHRENLHNTLLAVKDDYQSQKIELADAHTKSIDHETRALHRDLTQSNEQSERIIKATSEMEQATAELERKIEDDAEREIAELSFAAQKELQLLKQANALLTNEKNILQQRHVSMLGDLKELQQQVRSLTFVSMQCCLLVIDQRLTFVICTRSTPRKRSFRRSKRRRCVSMRTAKPTALPLPRKKGQSWTRNERSVATRKQISRRNTATRTC